MLISISKSKYIYYASTINYVTGLGIHAWFTHSIFSFKNLVGTDIDLKFARIIEEW